MNFTGTLGFTIVIPFLVFLVTRFGGNALVYGLVAATYPAFQFIGAPILGRWSDRDGRRRILLLSQIGTLISWLIFAGALFLPTTDLLSVDSETLGQFTLTLPLIMIFVARALDGLTGGNISVANAYVADISTTEERSGNFGKMGVAANLGMVLGPALAGVLGLTVWGEIAPVFAAIVFSVVGVVLIAAVLPESKPAQGLPDCPQGDCGNVLGQEPRDCIKAAKAKQRDEGSAFAQPNVAFILLLYFVILLSFNFYYTAFPVHASTVLGWDVTDIGIFFAVLSLMMVIVEGPILSRLSKRVGEPRLIIVGLAILGTNFLLMQSTSSVVLYIAAGFFAVGNGIMWPSMVSMVSKVTVDRFQGAVQGLAGSAGSLAAIIGLILGGIAYGAVGVETFAVCAGIAFISSVLALRLRNMTLAAERVDAESPA